MSEDNITTALEWRFYIGTTAAAANQSQFEADSYTEVDPVEDMGEFGDQFEDVTFTPLKSGRVTHLKGAKDGNVISLVVGRDPLDAGQQALDAAHATKFTYNVKVVAADAQNANYTDSVFYFRAKVMSKRHNVGNASNVVRNTYMIGINSDILEIPSEFVTSP
ncbi:hypothetical protein [Hyphomonas sp. UBA4494]|jgi:hypothetical protein|uniref:hypothetical protein n=1 Tax=Hyphomonas sp. UBA4494 TaxID=1946631 RepID=UPI0025C4BCA6|nr:hypothetical protein [Hyphomonas sp. UBA4494]